MRSTHRDILYFIHLYAVTANTLSSYPQVNNKTLQDIYIEDLTQNSNMAHALLYISSEVAFRLSVPAPCLVHRCGTILSWLGRLNT